MGKKIFFLLTICLLMTASVFASEVSHNTSVRVTGNSQKEITPDIAKIRLSINTINASLEQAKNANTQFSNQVFSKLKEREIADWRIKTEAYRIDPVYSYENNQLPKLTGYKVINTIEITTTIEKVGILVNELTNVGANEIDSIRFEKSNEVGLKNEALNDAVKDALQKAEVIAVALGKRILTVKEVIESGASYIPTVMALRAPKAGVDSGPPTIAAGKITIGATVQVTVELE